MTADFKGISLNGIPLDLEKIVIKETEITLVRNEEINRKPIKHDNRKKWRQPRRKVLDTKIYSKKDIEIEVIKRKFQDPETGHLVFRLFSNMEVILTDDGIYINPI